ncbi:MAG: TonB-dependent receptor [Rhodanobacter sp.]
MHVRKQNCAPIWRKTALAVALSMSFGGVAVAQSTTGMIFGTAPVAAGETVLVTNKTGVSREVAVDSNGEFRASNMPTGIYTVTLKKDGVIVDTRTGVALAPNAGASVSFTARKATTELSAVTVTAGALPAIDVTSVNSSTVITAADLLKLPVGRSAEAIALLAPNTMAGSGFFNKAVSFGGSSVAENGYYVNGYNTGEPYRNIGGFSMPYGTIDQQETLTGGYSAKYGRSDGGVINQIGKRGTDQWHFGVQVAWEPLSLSSSPDNTVYANVPLPAANGGGSYVLDNPALVGTLYQYRNKNKSTNKIYSAYVGGPLIKDTLYMFVGAEHDQTYGTTVTPSTSSRYIKYSNNTTKYYAKIDWNINENNQFELTTLKQKQTNNTGGTYNFDYATLKPTTFVAPNDKAIENADFKIAHYTSYINDDATLSVLYGTGTFHNPTIYGNTSNLPFISRPFAENPALLPPGTGPNGINNNQTNTSWFSPAASNHTKGLRVDFDYRLGDHDLGVGVDNMTYQGRNQGIGNTLFGPGYYWQYIKTSSGAYFARQRDITFQTSMSMEQKAYYLQDIWQVANNVQLNLGVRNDHFTNYTDKHIAFVDLKNQWEPRLGVSWDVNGDASFKIYGNAGRYYLALPDNVAERAANSSTYLLTDYNYTGIDANGIPTGLTLRRAQFSPDGETGAPKDPRQVTATNLKAQYLDEYILGFDKTLNDKWTYGAKLMYRDLKTAIDDECSPGQIATKMTAMGLNPNDYYNSLYGAAYCRLINPGLTNNMAIAKDDGSGYTNVSMSQKDWGYLQGVKRTYASLSLYLDHPFDGTWEGRIDYTYTHATGNTEGQVRSDFGQQDVSKTEDWDSWQLMQGQDGELSNSRKHVFRVRGSYQITPEWMIGGIWLVQSGTPKECLGYFGPNDNGDPTGYNAGSSSNYHWCFGKIVHPGYAHNPWTLPLNLGVRYTPLAFDKKLSVKLDVFNVFNEQRRLQSYPGSQSANHVIQNTYNQGIFFETPRAVRLTVSYDY